MGRAFNAIVQERNNQDDEKFPSLLADLKSYFQELSKEKTQGFRQIFEIVQQLEKHMYAFTSSLLFVFELIIYVLHDSSV